MVVKVERMGDNGADVSCTRTPLSYSLCGAKESENSPQSFRHLSTSPSLRPQLYRHLPALISAILFVYLQEDNTSGAEEMPDEDQNAKTKRPNCGEFAPAQIIRGSVMWRCLTSCIQVSLRMMGRVRCGGNATRGSRVPVCER